MKLLPTYYWFESDANTKSVIFLYLTEYIFIGVIQKCMPAESHLKDLGAGKLIRRTR